MSWKQYLPQDIQGLYEVHDFKHAAAILCNEFPDEFGEICQALREFRFTEQDITTPGGRESQIPVKFSNVLRPKGWKEGQMTASLRVDGQDINPRTHKVDYLKGRIAFDLEWNSKDQTFDRDLYAFEQFFNYNRISAGVLVTRSNQMDEYFKGLGEYTDRNGVKRRYMDKYGSSTTQMTKLLPRLEAGRNGGCPVLVFGITPRLLIREVI